jgi:hypothetical protein
MPPDDKKTSRLCDWRELARTLSLLKKIQNVVSSYLLMIGVADGQSCNACTCTYKLRLRMVLLIVVQLLNQLNTMVKADQNSRDLKGNKK